MMSYRVLLFPVVVCFALMLFGPGFAEDRAEEKSSTSEGFRFRGGDIQNGRTAFSTLNCVECHSIKNVDIPEPSKERRINLQLASETRFVKRYEDLILAITNPRHVITEQYNKILTDTELRGGIEPFMPDLTKDMSASQLIDLTAFLHSVYTQESSTYGGTEGR